jgi:hypothetical protein
MSSLSYYLDPPGIMAGCASPIYVISEPVDYSPGSEIVFEILAADAGPLQRRLGQRDQYGIDSSAAPFFGVLASLEPCQSTHFALSLMRQKPAMRGVLKVLARATIDVEAHNQP